jgi:uncharacterized protein YndB with AHSA1/START domain/predicted transcriptional regulator
MDEMEPVFKALADPHRRSLLDHLHERDGQTLTELQGYLPMSRFGVMKHLKLLEEAGLVTTRKVGREKFHYLNPVPIQQVYDRWVSKYAQDWARALVGLKYALEEPAVIATKTHVLTVFIRTTPERLWEALTDGDITRLYYFGSRFESDLTNGSAYRYAGDGDFTLIAGEVLEADPPRKLVTTFNAMWMPEEQRGPTTTVTYEIEPAGEACKLTLVHEGLDPAMEITSNVFNGWSLILSSLKSYLETGEALPTEM